ncbi:hypothetical protein PsYK624_013500 [Phanerochaete sordida]|uniref:Uncharacterized protein n=1 Tax=Phanerochaete sordida TaxID=48140 RepID=A0A9P3L7P0_9APHY|nr:hypothetical protein PsYK624_013500 [Phanerochaete sordida]
MSSSIFIPTATTAAPPSSTSGITFIPSAAPSGSKDHSTLRIVATIVPIVVIVAITLWGLLVAGGIMHHRSSYETDATPELNEKRGADDEPQLWEVSLKSVKPEDYHDALHPLALEVQPEQLVYYAARGHRSTSQIDITGGKRRLWRTFTSSSSITRTDAPLQQAQVSVLVVMPSPPATSPAVKHVDYAIGTRQALYRGEETKVKAQLEAHETPIMMDMCVYGYIG